MRSGVVTSTVSLCIIVHVNKYLNIMPFWVFCPFYRKTLRRIAGSFSFKKLLDFAPFFDDPERLHED